MNIFRKAEEDHNKTVETCKAALQLYFLNFKNLKNWYRIFFLEFFFYYGLLALAGVTKVSQLETGPKPEGSV